MLLPLSFPRNFLQLSPIQKKILVVSLVVWSTSSLLLLVLNLGGRKGVGSKAKPTVRSVLPLTAYGSQRHIFGLAMVSRPESVEISKEEKPVLGLTNVGGGLLLAIWLKDHKITASYSNNNGDTWDEWLTPLDPENSQNVVAALDKDKDLHFVSERDGRIYYQKVTKLVTEGRVRPENWIVSSKVTLDPSGFAHRPSLVIDRFSNLPAVAWSFQIEKGMPRLGRINFLRAKADPTSFANWCNIQGSSCGLSFYRWISGSANVSGVVSAYSTLHPALVQMSESGDFYLFWTNASRMGGKEVLKMRVAKRTAESWDWGEVKTQGEVGEETYKNFSLTSAVDTTSGRLAIAYADKEGKIKVVVYSSDGETKDISPNERWGSQFSLSAVNGKYYLFYRKENGRISGREYDTSWSEELLESPKEGGYPSVDTGIVSGKLFVVYTTSEGKIDFLSYSLIPPSPTLTLTPVPTTVLESTPSALPSEALTPTELPVLPSPTVEPTIIVTPTAEVTLEPTVTPLPVAEPTTTPTTPGPT